MGTFTFLWSTYEILINNNTYLFNFKEKTSLRSFQAHVEKSFPSHSQENSLSLDYLVSFKHSLFPFGSSVFKEILPSSLPFLSNITVLNKSWMNVSEGLLGKSMKDLLLILLMKILTNVLLFKCNFR